jgi:hypothetical protein
MHGLQLTSAPRKQNQQPVTLEESLFIPNMEIGGKELSPEDLKQSKTLLIVPTKNERDPPLFTGKLLIKFQNILRNTTQLS